MRRRYVLAGLAAVPGVGVLRHAAAQAPSQRPTIVVLIHGRESALRSRLEGFTEGLRELGWVDGRNCSVEVRWTDNQVDRLPALARDLMARKPDVAVGSPVLAAQALHRESTVVPIVLASGAGSQRLGLIASLARPGGNVTGIENQLDELAAKQVEFLTEIAPHAKRVLTLSSGLGIAEPDVRQGSRAAARVHGLRLIEALADSPAKLAPVAEACERERCDGMVVLVDPNLPSFRAEVIALASRLRVPAVYPVLEYADDGGLLAYSTDARALFRRSASFVDRILKGARPADLPVEQPTRFELVINLKTARAQGIRIPQSLLVRADRLIE